MKVFINGQAYLQYEKLELSLNYDTVASSYKLNARVDMDDPEHVKLFRPLSFNKVEISVGDFKVFTGSFISHDYRTSENPELYNVGGYSLPGVLADCEIPTEAYPLQDDSKTLKEIIEKIISPFGLSLHVNQIASDDANLPIAKAVARQSEKCASYITKLASQFNIIVGHSESGRLLLTRVRLNEAPQGVYRFGDSGYTSGSIRVDASQIHSRYTVKRQTSLSSGDSDPNAESIVDNSVIPVFRPTIKTQSVGSGDLSDTAVKSLRAKELGSISFKITVNSLVYPNGDPIRPNRIIVVRDPNIYLPNDTKLFVRTTKLVQTANSAFAVLDCVFPNALTGEPLTNIFE